MKNKKIYSFLLKRIANNMNEVDLELNQSYMKLINLRNVTLIQFIKILNENLSLQRKSLITVEQIKLVIQKSMNFFMQQEQFNRNAMIYIQSFVRSLRIDISDIDKKENEDILAILISIIIDKLDFTFVCHLICNNLLLLVEEKLNSKLLDHMQIVRNAKLDQKYVKEQVQKYCLSDIKMKIKELLTGNKEYDPYELEKVVDKKDKIQYVNKTALEFPPIRTAPIVIMDDLPFTGMQKEQHTDILNRLREKCKNGTETRLKYNSEGKTILEEFGVNNLGLGSTFNKIVLLEYITDGSKEQIIDGIVKMNTGNIDLICQTLINTGYNKVYLQNKQPFMSKEYIRKANFN